MELLYMNDLAQKLYEAYANSRNWQRSHGETMEQWADLNDKCKMSWEEVSACAHNHFNEKLHIVNYAS
jgi:hypothetical protein